MHFPVVPGLERCVDIREAESGFLHGLGLDDFTRRRVAATERWRLDRLSCPGAKVGQAAALSSGLSLSVCSTGLLLFGRRVLRKTRSRYQGGYRDGNNESQ